MLFLKFLLNFFAALVVIAEGLLDGVSKDSIHSAKISLTDIPNKLGISSMQQHCLKHKHRVKRKFLHRHYNLYVTYVWDSTLWPKKQIKYSFENYDAKKIGGQFKVATEYWQNSTCLRFTKVKKGAKDFHIGVFGLDQNSGWSLVGYSGYSGKMNCMVLPFNPRVDLIAHELGHSIGLLHEQNRLDRNEDLEVYWENIKMKHDYNYKVRYNKSEQTDLELIDYGSIMMYSYDAFAKDNRKFAMKPKDTKFVNTMGSANYPSFLDIYEVNSAYKCMCKNPLIKCFNHGYPKVNDCSKCECPEGTGGKMCDRVESTEDGGYILADDNWSKLKRVLDGRNLYSPYRSVYHIRAPENKKIEIMIVALENGFQTPLNRIQICDGSYVEFKLNKDLRPTGYRFCDMTHTQYLHSIGRHAIVIHNDDVKNYKIPKSAMHLQFRAVDVNKQLPMYVDSGILPLAEIVYDDGVKLTSADHDEIARMQLKCCGHFALIQVHKGKTAQEHRCQYQQPLCQGSLPWPIYPEKPISKQIHHSSCNKSYYLCLFHYVTMLLMVSSYGFLVL